MAHLTVTEQRIMALIATKGLTNAEVSIVLGCSEKTIKVHVSNLFRKVGVSNRVKLALTYHGLLEQ